MNVAILRNEAREVATRMEGRLQAAINDNFRELTAEEEAAQVEDEAKLARLTKQIGRVEQL